MEKTYRKLGEKGVKQAYRNNLECVMRHVSSLIKDLEERTVITSDHGELLGENNDYSHYSWKDEKQLREVPWLEVE